MCEISNKRHKANYLEWSAKFQRDISSYRASSGIHDTKEYLFVKRGT